MKGFIVDRTYRIIEKQAYVYCFGRLANGESFLTINHFKPFFYIKKGDLAKAKKIASFDYEATNFTTMEGEPVVKITLATPKEVPLLRKAFEDQNIPCFEADIRFTQRFLMEHAIFATMDIQGEHKKGRYVDRIYENPILTPVSFTPSLTTLSFDIETSMDGKLYCITLATRKKRVTLFLRDAELHNLNEKEYAQVEFFDEEKALLERFAALIRELDPDVITGWNVIDFDLADLKRRFEQQKVPFRLGRADWDCSLRLEKSYLRDSTAEVPGRMVLDGIHLVRSSFLRLSDYKLETAAQTFLGEGKLVKGEERHTEIERLYNEDPARLIAYNQKDAELVLDILEKLHLVELTTLRSMLTGLTMDRVRASIASFDSVYLRRMHAQNLVAPTTRFAEKERPITGGYVRESKPGMYEYILVLDFKSMYPSVIRTFNIDPVSYLPDCHEKRTTREVIVAPNGACFKNQEGLLPQIIQELWEEREKAKRRKDDVASLALKTLMNSFFGVLASPNCRFFSLAMANAITHFARKFIKLAAEKTEELGYEVIYGDTDSIFVRSGAKSVEEAEKRGIMIQERINTYYEEHVKAHYYRKNFMELEFEKVYRKFLMPTVRGSDIGAKKRYAGLLIKDGKEQMDFTGLEFVRRDWTELAKQFQLSLLDKIFHDKEVTTFVKRFVADVKAGKYDNLLVYKKSIRKELSAYVKTTPPHVKAARILQQKLGGVPSRIIEYVMTKNGPEPVGFETAEIDYDHYIEKQIKPIADSILGFYNTSFDELIAGSSQKTLFGY